jgi:hypothetical protein
MFLNIPLVADWNALTTKREHLINANLRRQNAKRRRYDYRTDQQVLKQVHKPTKLGDHTTGPYTVQQVHVNGSITIQLRPGVTERLNIRRVRPYEP